MTETDALAPFEAASADTTPANPHTSRRAEGVDIARAVAMIGMMAVHIGPTNLNTAAGMPFAMCHGRASVAFALIAGVGVSLLAASRAATPGRARMQLAWRAIILLPMGLMLQELDHWILVILQNHALLFLLAIAVLGLPNRLLLLLAGVSAVLGPLWFLWGQIEEPQVYRRTAVAISDSLGDIAHRLVLSGPYPLITWAAPFLVGMWIGRKDIRAGRTRWLLAGCGLAAAALAFFLSRGLQRVFGEPGFRAGWDYLTLDGPHSQMPLWLLGATGAAVFILGLSLILAHAVGRCAWPLTVTGQLALTVYVAHLFALHWWRGPLTSRDPGEAGFLLLGMAGAAVIFCVIWRALFSRGPLEALFNPRLGVFLAIARFVFAPIRRVWSRRQEAPAPPSGDGEDP